MLIDITIVPSFNKTCKNHSSIQIKYDTLLVAYQSNPDVYIQARFVFSFKKNQSVQERKGYYLAVMKLSGNTR